MALTNWKYKVTWQTEYDNGKLDKDDEPRYFDSQREASQYMKDLVWECKNGEYLSFERQVIKLYWGTRLIDVWDSKPKRSQVMKAKTNAKRKADRRL